MTYRGLRLSEVTALDKMYIELSGAGGLPLYRKCVYWLMGSRMVIVALEHQERVDQIVGFDMFYFNKRDIRERTIHEGFVGVACEFRRKGIATNLRRCAIKNFCRSGVLGISSRIDIDNAASLNSAIEIGFRPVEQYRDEVLGVDRYYLVNCFKTLKREDFC